MLNAKKTFYSFFFVLVIIIIAVPNLINKNTAVHTNNPSKNSQPYQGVLQAALTPPAGAMTAPAGYSNLIFEDQFLGTTLDGTKWIPQIADQTGIWNDAGKLALPYSAVGNDGGNNAEYGNPTDVVVNNGLTLNAEPDISQTGYSYRAGYITTHGKFTFTGGYVQIKAKMPDSTTGGWAGLWFLEGGAEIDLDEAGYTGCGAAVVNQCIAMNLHSAGNTQTFYNAGVDLSAGYHIYGMEYKPGQSVTMYLDGIQIGQFTSNVPTGAFTIVVTNTMAQNATGWHTNVGATTPSLLSMNVSEVQVWQTTPATPTPVPPTPTPTGPIAVAINPVQDATVDFDTQDTNYGTLQQLEVNGQPKKITYFEFDVTPFAGKIINNAKLHIYSTNASINSTSIKTIRSAIGNNWTETGITYRTQPNWDKTVTTFTNVKPNQWIDVDLTSYVQSHIGNKFTIRIESVTSNDEFAFYSRESAINKPELDITYDPASIYVAPTPTPPPPAFAPSSCSATASDTIILIDISSSMLAGSSINLAKAAAQSFVDLMAQNPANRIGLAVISRESASRLVTPLTSNYAQVKTAISGLSSISGSCLQCGAYISDEELINNGRPGVSKNVIMLTDGRADLVYTTTPGNSGHRGRGVRGGKTGYITPTANYDQLLTAVEVEDASAYAGLVYYTVGYGGGVQQTFLQGLAQTTGGSYYYAADATYLQGVYSSIANDIGIGNGTISGFLYKDANYNHVYDTGDSVLPGWTVSMIGSGISTPVTLTTDSNGQYRYGGLCDGQYQITESVPPNWIQWTPTSPPYYFITLANGATVNNAIFGNVEGYMVKGNIFVDQNKNRTKDNFESNYIGNFTITSDSGSVSLNTTNGTYQVVGLLPNPGTYTISFPTILPVGYQMVYPVNGPPPSFTFTVGPGCSVNSTTGAKCDSIGNINDLNFAITDSIPWVQSEGLDMRFDNGITDYVAAAPACAGPYAAIPGSSSTAGILFSGNNTPIFGKGNSSANKWVVGGSSYPELFKTSKSELPSSYNTIIANLNKSGTPIIDLATVCTISNCTLPNTLPAGAYKANGDLRLFGHNFKNNQNYVFIINGSLTILGDITVPKGSTTLFSAANDIIVDKSVGSNPSCTTASNLEGFYSADNNVTIQGINDCTVSADKMLQIEGGVFVNAGLNSGTFTYNRDLCINNYKYPTISFIERPDFIVNAPNVLKRKGLIFQELAP